MYIGIILLIVITLTTFYVKEPFTTGEYYWPNTAHHWYGGYGGIAMQPRLNLKNRLDPYF